MPKLKVDEHSQLIGFPHHDGMLLGVRCPDEGTLELEIKNTEGVSLCLNLQGVCRFVLSDFREGNIVDRIFLWKGSEVSDNLSHKLNSFFGDYTTELLTGTRQKEIVVFSLESSYGAHLYCLLSHKNGLNGVLKNISIKSSSPPHDKTSI